MMYCRANWLLLAVVVGLGLSAMLNACGQKGPLYLPDSRPAPATASDRPASPAQPTD